MKCILLTGCLIIAAQGAQCAEKVPAAAPQIGVKASGQDSAFAGKVSETMNTAGYTYILVDTGTRKVWAAAPSFAVKVGDSVTVAGAVPMPQYHSKTLNRDFDVVYFTGSVVVNGGPPAVGGKAAELPKGHPPLAGAAATPQVDLSGIKKADGGKTIAEIFDGKEKLSGQQVKLRGRVVKANAKILGKNWLHIRDGSGTEGSNDLLVTTTSEAKPGDTVLITGTVALNQEFGSGYKYPVMIEAAKVVVE